MPQSGGRRGHANAGHLRRVKEVFEKPPEEPSTVDCEQQLDKQAKLRSMLQLPAFDPASEREFEAWVDATASQLHKLDVSIAICKGAWESVTSEAFAARLREIRLPATRDEFVDEVAKFDGF